MSVLTAAQRRKSALIKPKPGEPASDAKFPMPDASHARNALARLDQAKPALSMAQKAKAVRRAKKLGVVSETYNTDGSRK